MSGRSMMTRRSKRPGRSSAGSRTSGRFVAAMTMTLSTARSRPSRRGSGSVSARARRCRRRRPAPRAADRVDLVDEDDGRRALLGRAKRSRTRDAPTPTNISTNSEPEMEKKGTPASPATARASKVFPVPGGPMRKTPFGILAPTATNFFGLLKKSTTSISSSFASASRRRHRRRSRPFLSFFPYSRAPDCPNDMARMFWPWIERIMMRTMMAMAAMGRTMGIITPIQTAKPLAACTLRSMAASLSSATPRFFMTAVNDSPTFLRGLGGFALVVQDHVERKFLTVIDLTSPFVT